MAEWITGEELNKLKIKPPKRKGIEYNYKTKSWWNGYYCSNCLESAYCDTDFGDQLFPFCPWCGAEMRVAEWKKITVKKPLVKIGEN